MRIDLISEDATCDHSSEVMMTKMNWNRARKVPTTFYPDSTKPRGCAHVWFKHGVKWDQCTKCKKYKPNANNFNAHPEQYAKPTTSGRTATRSPDVSGATRPNPENPLR